MIKDFRWVQDFKCTHCHTYVSGDSLLSGVKNRNHCPYCLWSKHLDLHQAGDRLSACKAGMQPVGLALKRSQKKYGSAQGGELMLVHHCTGCRTISINCIAADDIAEGVFKVYEDSLIIRDNIRARLEANGVLMLGVQEQELVRRRLFGESFGTRMAPDREYSFYFSGQWPVDSLPCRVGQGDQLSISVKDAFE